MKTRVEQDYIGVLEVPSEAYYGVQSMRARENFPITGRKMSAAFIRSIAEVKKAAALQNCQAGELDTRRAEAIVKACDELIAGALTEEFIVDPVQGGAGTSANMNANEVIANRAIELLGGEKGDYTVVHPNDHVNRSQSTNDVFPTAGKLTALRLIADLKVELDLLESALEQKAEQFDDVIKIGRTQLQDAVPIRLGQEFHAYAQAVKRDSERLERAAEELCSVNIGGTAVGTALNASPRYLAGIAKTLRQVTGLPVRQAEDLVDATQNLDCFVSVSGALKACAVNLSKIANDLRLLSSGPRAGISEIVLPARQNGSSIMPGKINPVIPEVVSQVAFGLIGNDTAITLAAEAGQLELNAFEPILFYKLFESITTLTGAVRTFTENCIKDIKANTKRCRELLDRSTGTATALCPLIGYKKAAEIAKQSLKTGTPVREIVRESGILENEKLAEILNPKRMTGKSERACRELTALSARMAARTAVQK